MKELERLEKYVVPFHGQCRVEYLLYPEEWVWGQDACRWDMASSLTTRVHSESKRL